MSATIDALLSVIIPAASGVAGAALGAWSSWRVQTLRLRQEMRLEIQKQTAEQRLASENRRVQFRLRRWEIEAEALAEIKKKVKSVSGRLRAAITDTCAEEITRDLADIGAYSSRITRHSILMANLFAFDREARLAVSNRKKRRSKSKSASVYHSVYEYETEILSESDRLILEQPDLTRVEKLTRAVAYVMNDLRTRTTFAPENEARRTKVLNHLLSLNDEEMVELGFETEELSSALNCFKRSAGKVFGACDFLSTGEDITKTEHEQAVQQMLESAAMIRTLMMAKSESGIA